MIVQFKTPTSVPLEAFSLMGVNVKTSNNAIGRFGTGLKYAVAVILRYGGSIQLFVDGVEHEFYLSKKEFRGKTFQQVRMRKRYGVGKWLGSKPMPFTTEFGKDWSLWQAYRELESNTRDEGGSTEISDDESHVVVRGPDKGTLIVVSCPGFAEAIEDAKVFLPEEAQRGKQVFSNIVLDIYDTPSKYLYYQGIRIYELRYPARLTYDFKAPYVTLTEDRTAANAYALIWNITRILQHEVRDKGTLYKALNRSKLDDRYDLTFETHELNFDWQEQGSDAFAMVVDRLQSAGSGGRSVAGYASAYRGYTSLSAEKTVSLPRKHWQEIAKWLKLTWPDGSYPGDGAIEALMGKIDNVVPF